MYALPASRKRMKVAGNENTSTQDGSNEDKQEIRSHIGGVNFSSSTFLLPAENIVFALPGSHLLLRGATGADVKQRLKVSQGQGMRWEHDVTCSFSISARGFQPHLHFIYHHSEQICVSAAGWHEKLMPLCQAELVRVTVQKGNNKRVTCMVLST